MNFLYILEGMRTPFLDFLFSLLTHLGDETFFIAAALCIFWCLDKRWGYYLLTVGFFGIILNETLKLIFRIPRPWLKDMGFSVVESARARALGYSFPSGHTQNAACLFGSAALWNKKAKHGKPFAALCILLFLSVAFSRMYLGVHTPYDVAAATVIGIFLVFGFYAFFESGKDNERKSVEKRFSLLLPIMLFCSAAYVAFAAYLYYSSNGSDGILSENANVGMVHGCYMLGGIIGLLIGYPTEQKHIRFKARAPFAVQLAKLLLGFALVMLIKSGLKAPLLALFGGLPIAHALRYGITVWFGIAVWPRTFPFWERKLGSHGGQVKS